MSLFRSILPGRALQRADYDLPLYRTYQEAEAFPPAPVAPSIHLPSVDSGKRSMSIQPARSDDLVVLARREKHYQQKLQELLDAQSDGLIAGLEDVSTGQDERESQYTPTQTTYSLRSGSVSPQPHERKRKRTLGQARRGIWKTVLDCAAVKEEEDFLLKQELKNDQAILRQLEAWTIKEHGLNEKITVIENEDTGAKADELKKEASKLKLDIQEMETRLAQMKTRQRRVMSELADVENSISSKLSSYKTSLSMLQEDVQSFLQSPPATTDRQTKDSPFLALPTNRRTLDMAKEHWQNHVEELKKQRRAARRDFTALQDGAEAWSEVVAEITEFEKYLRREITTLAHTQISALESKGKGPISSPPTSPQELLSRTDAVLQTIEEKLELARRKRWRLLEVCIEAELRALEQGKEMLEQMLSIQHHADNTPPSLIDGDESEPEKELSTQSSGAKDIFASAAEGFSNVPASQISHSAALRKSMYDDDDGPDPELLFTRPSDDTE